MATKARKGDLVVLERECSATYQGPRGTERWKEFCIARVVSADKSGLATVVSLPPSNTPMKLASMTGKPYVHTVENHQDHIRKLLEASDSPPTWTKIEDVKRDILAQEV